MYRIVITLILITINLYARGLTAQDESGHVLEKLNALTRTIGYVRYFHPSDQAALINWNGMAYYGTEQALNSSSEETTAELIERLFSPVVVDLKIYQGDEQPRPDTKRVSPKEILAWQHSGIGLGTQGLYKSIRLNRKQQIAVPTSGQFGNMLCSVDPKPLQGKEIRCRFDAKIETGRCHLQGWWRVERESKRRGLFDNMNDRRIREKSWQEYTLIGTVNDDAQNLTFGFMIFGIGSALVDNVRLEWKDGESWQEIELTNADFEQGDSRPDGWVQTVKGYSIETETKDVSSGKQSARIQRRTSTQNNAKIFNLIPELGEVVDAEIAPELRLRMPLALPVNTTYSTGDNQETDQFIQVVNNTKIDDADQRIASLANVVLAWSVFQHFYPYFDQVNTDWDGALNTALKNGIAAGANRDQATKNLQWLVAQLHDGHGNVYDMNSRELFAPVSFGWVEDQLIVTASNNDQFLVGDIVSHVDNIPASDFLNQMEEYISGSPQWKRYRSTNQLSSGTAPRKLDIQRGDQHLQLRIEFEGRQRAEQDKGEICRIEVDGKSDSDDIWYIDMGRAEPSDVIDKIQKFAVAKGIVLDFRGYPRGTQFLFQYMTDQHMQSQKWQVPHQVHPDRIDMSEIAELGRWQMPPRKPRFDGKMIFITNGSAISYAESCMAIVAHYKLGDIIGSPTAGANGNVNPFELPGGYRVAWTGMRVMNHDDSQHHLNGVQVTIPMKPTLKGIRSGRDELLEKAVEIIAGQEPK